MRTRVNTGEGSSLFRSWTIGAALMMIAASLLLAGCGGTGDEPASGGGE